MATSLGRSGNSRPLRALVDAGRYREALGLYLQSYDTAVPSAQSRLLASQAAARLGEFEVSSRLARAARESFMADCDTNGILDATSLLGVIALERGKVRDAEAHFAAAAALAGGTEFPRHRARSAFNQATVALQRGELDRADTQIREALRGFEAEADVRGVAECCHGLAVAAMLSERLEEARAWSGRAISCAEQSGEAGLIATTMLGFAELRIAEGHYSEAEGVIERAELLSWAEGNKPQRLDGERLRALIELKTGKPAAAHQRATVVQARAAESQYALIAALARTIAALALQADGRHTEAMACRDAAQVSLKSLGARLRLERFEREWAAPHRPL